MAAGVEGDRFLFTSESVGEGHPGMSQSVGLPVTQAFLQK